MYVGLLAPRFPMLLVLTEFGRAEILWHFSHVRQDSMIRKDLKGIIPNAPYVALHIILYIAHHLMTMMYLHRIRTMVYTKQS